MLKLPCTFATPHICHPRMNTFAGRGGDFEGEERRERFEDEGPSRADTAESWGADRKFVPGGAGGPGRGGEVGRQLWIPCAA